MCKYDMLTVCVQNVFRGHSTLALIGGIRPLCNCLVLQLSPPYLLLKGEDTSFVHSPLHSRSFSKAFFVLLSHIFYTAYIL